jgi:hypothetical protein
MSHCDVDAERVDLTRDWWRNPASLTPPLIFRAHHNPKFGGTQQITSSVQLLGVITYRASLSQVQPIFGNAATW